MQTVISGRAGIALLLEGNELRYVRAGSGEIVRCREQDVPHLLGDATDLQFLDGLGLPEAARRLELATAQAEALHLALILLDPELPPAVRRSAADDLPDLLESPEIRGFVEGVLFSRPLAGEADLAGAFACSAGGPGAVHDLLFRLRGLQGEIAEVSSAWDQIPTPVFGSEPDRAAALAAAVRQGLFRDLVSTRATYEPLEAFFTRALSDEVFRAVPNAPQILREWVLPLRPELVVPGGVALDTGMEQIRQGLDLLARARRFPAR